MKEFISLKDKLSEEELLEFDYERNDKKPEEISYGSATKYWWKCSKEHLYQARPNDKVFRHSGCPYCAGQKVLEGFNDMATTNPNLAEEWNYEKNGEIKPTEITAGSSKKYFWKCKEGHSWEAASSTRLKGHGCPYCAGQKVIEGNDNLETLYPELIKEWSNDNLSKPSDFLSKSHQKVLWEHEVELNGKKFIHKWEATIASRTSGGNGCPYCSNQKIIKGYNDLRTLRPDLMKEWDYDKNTIDPTKLPLNSPKKAFWRHSVVKDGKVFEHSWESVIYSRTSGNKNCPYCSGRAVQIGFNDLKSNNPELVKEWDYSKNDKNPEELTYGTRYKAHWICSKGHKYSAQVSDRRYGDGCPECSKSLRTSVPEKIIYYYMKQLFPDTTASYKCDWLGRMELDIYIPSIKFAIEYDGQRWHKDKYQHDLDKIKLCKENNVTLYRIREPKCPKINGKYIYELKTLKKQELEEVLNELVNVLSKKTRKVLKLDINISRDMENILKLLEK